MVHWGIIGILIISIFQGCILTDFVAQESSGGSSWTQDTEEDFRNGTLNNASIYPENNITLDFQLNYFQHNFTDQANISYHHNLIINSSRSSIKLEKEFNIFRTKMTDVVQSVQHTNDGGYIIVGYTESYGAGNYDLWLIKTDSIGQEQWNRTFGGNGDDYGFSIQQTPDYGFIITGATCSYGGGDEDVWLIKTNSTGDEQWKRVYNGNWHDRCYDVNQTLDGGYILTGRTKSYGYGNSFNDDLWIIKVNSTGHEQWNKTFGGFSSDEEGRSVQETFDNNYIIIGNRHPHVNSNDLWLIKINSTGHELWNETIGGNEVDYVYSGEETSDHGFIITGTTGSYGGGGLWLVKTNSTGNEQWNKTFQYKDYGFCVKQTFDGGYIITGFTPDNGMDAFLLKTDQNGSEEWNRTFGYEKEESGYCVLQNPDGGFTFIGGTRPIQGTYMDSFIIITNETGCVEDCYGELESANLLPGKIHCTLNEFICQANVPVNTNLKVQFSKNQTHWYNSTGALNNWDNLTDGLNRIYLSEYNWNSTNFYYRLNFTSFDFKTPDVRLINVSYNQYLDFGTYISIAFYPGGNVTWRTLNWSAIKPNGTEISFQLRTANSEIELASKSFIGPDGSSNTYYNDSGMNIWSGHNYQSWMQYKVLLKTNNINITPILEKVILEYNFIPNPPNLTFPNNNSWIYDNTPSLNWSFKDLDSSFQSAFQIMIDDVNNFTSINFNSGIQNTTNQTWQFPNDTGYTSIPDGVWYWCVRTKDSDGDWGPYSSSWKFIVDTKNPTSTITNPINNSFVNRWKLDDIKGTAVDNNGSGLKKVEITIKQLSDNKYWDRSTWSSSEYWLNVSGTTSWSYEVGSVGFANGVQYLIRSRATDNASNVENSSYGVVFTFDTTSPSSNIDDPINGNYYNSTVPISGSATDSLSGIHSVEVAIKRLIDNNYWSTSGWIAVENWLRANGHETWTFDSSNVAWTSGWDYEIKSRAVDNATNVEMPSSGHSFYCDLDNPTSTITNPNDGAWLNSLDEITGTFIDTGSSGVQSVGLLLKRESDNYFWDGSDWSVSETWLSTTVGGDWSYDSSLVPWKQNEVYIAVSLAIDNAVNYELLGSGIEFYFDCEVPYSKIDNILPNSYLNKLNIISGTAEDGGGSGMNHVRVFILRTSDNKWWYDDVNKWVDNEVPLFAIGTDTWSYNASHIPLTDGVEYVVYSIAFDNVNNNGSVIKAKTNAITFIFDNSAPIISIKINNDDEFTNSKTVSLTLTADDTSSDVDLVSYSIDNQTWSSWGAFSESNDIDLLSGDGEKTVYYRVKDLAGNIALTLNNIILDTTPPPKVDIAINHGKKFTNSKDVILSLNATDALSGLDQMSFSSDGEYWTSWESYEKKVEFTLEDGDGEQTVHYQINDKAGNIKQATDSIILDTTAPYSLSINISKYVTDVDETTVIYQLYAIDDISGVSKMTFSEDGINWEDWTDFTTEGPPIHINGIINMTIYFKVKDHAGNEADPVTVILKIDSSDFIEFLDSDKDGILDNEDAFPNEPTQWQDRDGDNYGDNLKGKDSDLFPDDPLEWDDTDGDNFGDNTDAFPNNPNKWKEEEQPPEEKSGDKDDSNLTWMIIGVIITIVVILILLFFLFFKKKKKNGDKPDDPQPPQPLQTQQLQTQSQINQLNQNQHLSTTNQFPPQYPQPPLQPPIQPPQT